MEATEFEAWALGKLRNAGYSIFRTPWTHDCGADGVAKKEGQRDIVIQCKHSQTRSSITAIAIRDLLRAKDAYAMESPIMVAITNSDGFNREAIDLARRHNVHLLARAELQQWPQNVIAN
jgi:HJR/Mrr/RecB family endonuclease